MIKKPSIYLILFASLLLLAFTVIPHHHHQQKICFLQSHCENDADSNKKDSNGDSHKHDCEGYSNGCILQEPVVVPSNQWKPEIKFDNCINDDSGIDDFQGTLASNPVKPFIHVLYNIASVPLNNCSYSCHVSSSLGLRAPPVV